MSHALLDRHISTHLISQLHGVGPIVVLTLNHDFFLKFIYLERERAKVGQEQRERERERERVHAHGRGRERGRERIPSRLRAVSAEPDTGLELVNCEIMT